MRHPFNLWHLTQIPDRFGNSPNIAMDPMPNRSQLRCWFTALGNDERFACFA